MKTITTGLICLLMMVALMQCSTYRGPQKTRALEKKFFEKYVDRVEEGGLLLRAWYNSSVERTKDGQTVYKQYYPSTEQITHYITFSDATLRERQGPSVEWYDNGNKFRQGEYTKNKKEGKWQFFSYDTGDLIRYGNYRDDLEEGLWIGLDTLGNKISEYQYLNGKMHGPYKIWKHNGVLSEQGVYQNGELISRERAESTVQTGNFGAAFVPDVFPYLKGCENANAEEIKKCSDRKLLATIYKQIRYPTLAREMGIEGETITRFVVGKDGSISDVQVMRGLCDEIARECTRVIELLPAWNPGMQNGEEVRVLFHLPIRFRLE